MCLINVVVFALSLKLDNEVCQISAMIMLIAPMLVAVASKMYDQKDVSFFCYHW